MTAPAGAERIARAALTWVAEPGDPVMGALLGTCSAAEIVAALTEGRMPRTAWVPADSAVPQTATAPAVAACPEGSAAEGSAAAETISDKSIGRIAALGGGIAVQQYRIAYQGEYFVERYGFGAAETARSGG